MDGCRLREDGQKFGINFSNFVPLFLDWGASLFYLFFYLFFVNSMDFATREFFSGSCALIWGYKCTEFETLTCAFVVEHAKISGIFSIFIFLFFFLRGWRMFSCDTFSYAKRGRRSNTFEGARGWNAKVNRLIYFDSRPIFRQYQFHLSFALSAIDIISCHTIHIVKIENTNFKLKPIAINNFFTFAFLLRINIDFGIFG